MTTIEQILDLARWAPSGDNTQPWRFEIVDSAHVVVHGFDTRQHCVYDLDGHASQVAIGCLLENITIAATAHRLRAEIKRQRGAPDDKPTFDVYLVEAPANAPDALIAFIRRRTVNRHVMRTRPLTLAQKRGLEAAIGTSYQVLWFESIGDRLHLARLMFDNAKVRLTIPEAYEVHRSIIEWGVRFSEDRVPDRALSIDPLTRRLMRQVMASWRRVEFFNTYLAGHLLPRIEMDLLPGVLCAAHFTILAAEQPQTPDDYIASGRAVQRFWLTATQLELQMQPEMTPLIFSRYARMGLPFTRLHQARAQAEGLADRLDGLMGKAQAQRAVFAGRIGAGSDCRSRSLRLSLRRLMR